LQQPQPPPPIIVKIIEPPNDPTGGLGDLLLSALGVSGVMFVGAILMGIVTAALLYWVRSRAA
jgi:hypothetical protein